MRRSSSSASSQPWRTEAPDSSGTVTTTMDTKRGKREQNQDLTEWVSEERIKLEMVGSASICEELFSDRWGRRGRRRRPEASRSNSCYVDDDAGEAEPLQCSSWLGVGRSIGVLTRWRRPRVLQAQTMEVLGRRSRKAQGRRIEAGRWWRRCGEKRAMVGGGSMEKGR